MMQVGTNQSTKYHNQSSISSSGGQTGRSSSTSRQQQPQQSQYDNEQLANIRPRLCTLRKWPHYDGYGVHLARNQHWLGLRVGDVEPNSPAESGGLLREDVVLSVNGHSVENDDFFVILSFIQHELEDEQIRFLVLDPLSADLARRNHLNIDENYRSIVRMETPPLTVSPEKLLYDQWRSANNIDPTVAQSTIHLGPTNQILTSTNASRFQEVSSHDAHDNVYTFLPYSDHAMENGRSFFDILFDQDNSTYLYEQQLQHSIQYKSTKDSTSDKKEDTNNNLASGTRMSSLSLRSGNDTIGISIQPDNEFGHIISHVEPNSPAERAGIQKDDCIVSLNNTPLLNIPYEDVLNIIKKSREQPSVDFLVAKKSYLIKTRENNSNFVNQQRDSSGRYTDTTTSTAAEVMASSNISGRNNSSNVPPSQALEQLYNKYNNEQTNPNRSRETVSTTTTTNEQYDRLGQQLDNDRYSSKQQKGQILQGVGPATADRSSWGVSSGKSTDDFQGAISGDSSIRSNSQGRRRDTDDTKGRGSSLEDSFKPLQVGITNPAASQQSDEQRTSRPTSSSQQRDNSPRGSSGLDTGATKTLDTTYSESSRENQTIQNLENAVPIAPAQKSSTSRDYEQEIAQTAQSKQSDFRLGTTKAMSAPSKPNKSKSPMNIYDDTDDDDLSDISERSREDDISDPAMNKNSQSSIVEYTDDKIDKTYSDKNQNEKREFTSTNSDAGQKIIGTAMVGSTTVKARRLEQSDSEETDSQRAKQSAADSFYSPNESVEKQNDTDEDQEEEEDEEHSSNEASSNEGRKTPVPMGKMAFATMSLSELQNYGYELHDIQLMQPTETSPVGLKLTKQQDPLQYIITAVAKGTKADLAGLKVNDWLIKIEDNDIRLVEFAEVSQDIRQLLTNAGLINMVVARKRSSTSPKAKQLTPSSSRSDSFDRQQAAQTSVLTTDITRDTPDNSQVRFIPDRSTSPPTSRSERSQISTRETNTNTTSGPLSVGLTNPISDENQTKTPRSQSRSPTREYTINTQQKTIVSEQTSEEYDPNDIRHVVLKEALGLDFNSFIPEGDSQIQTHFISNVQPSSMADRAGLRDGDRILTVNGVDVTNSVHEDVRRMMQSKKPLQLSVVNDPKYLELIENVKRNQNKTEDSDNRGRPLTKSLSNDSNTEPNVVLTKSEESSPKPARDDLSKYLSPLFIDDEGTIQVKHCILKKDPTYNGYGLLLRYQNGLHLIDQVEEYSPAYNAGLREDDVILYVDRKNVEQMTHDDVKILIRRLSLSNTDIDLLLIRKNDVQRYKAYQEHNTIDWKPILQNKLYNETNQTEQQETREVSVVRSSNDQTSSVARSSKDQTSSVPRQSSTTSASSAKQQAPAPPPTSTAQPTSAPGTRVCILQPSAARTAGFALSGKSPPPYVICQIEKNSPAEKAGLLLNDVLLSINGTSVIDKSYEDTVKLVKEALQQKSVELVVQDQTSIQSKDRTKLDSQSSTSDQLKLSMGSNDSNNLGNTGSIGSAEPSRQGSNAVEEYQKQRNKELSYTLRICHLHPTNGDGTQAATFGFELSEDPDYEYPLILRVEPQSPAEGAGLQSRDILLKINDRKTKGLGYDKVKKEIEKAKRDGRLEMLVVDQETFDYCKRTKKPLKEPEMKVKHIFPKGRSSASVHKLPVAAVAAASSISSRDSVEQSNTSITKHDDSIPTYQHTSVGYRLSTPKETDSENEDNNQQNLSRKKISPNISTLQSQPAVNFDLNTPTTAPYNASALTRESPLKFFDPAQSTSQQRGTSSTARENVPSTARSTPALNQTSTKESKNSKRKAIPNAINNLFHRIGHPKSSKRS